MVGVVRDRLVQAFAVVGTLWVVRTEVGYKCLLFGLEAVELLLHFGSAVLPLFVAVGPWPLLLHLHDIHHSFLLLRKEPWG